MLSGPSATSLASSSPVPVSVPRHEVQRRGGGLGQKGHAPVENLDPTASAVHDREDKILRFGPEYFCLAARSGDPAAGGTGTYRHGSAGLCPTAASCSAGDSSEILRLRASTR